MRPDDPQQGRSRTDGVSSRGGRRVWERPITRNVDRSIIHRAVKGSPFQRAPDECRRHTRCSPALPKEDPMKRGRSVSANLRRGAALAALGVLAGCDVSSKPLVAMFAVRTPTGVGYGIVNSGGVIYGVNGVPSDHTLEHTRLNGPIIDATPRPKGGVWLVATDGGVFSLGGAPYYGNVLGQVAPGT